MQAGDADIVEAGDGGAEELGGEGGFFGDGEVGGAGAEDGDVAGVFGLECGLGCGLAQGDDAGLRVVDGGGGLGESGLGGGGVGAGGEDVLPGGGHAGEDFGGLGGRFAGRVDDLGEAGAQGAVVVDAGFGEGLLGVFEGQGSEALGGGGGGEFSALDSGQEREEGVGGHVRETSKAAAAA